MIRICFLWLCLLAGPAFSASYVTKTLPTSHLLLPKQTPESVVVLVSDADGWSADEAAVAERLVARKAAVIGVDLPQWYAALSASPADCLYLVSDIETLTQQIHREAKIATYRAPIVAGAREGGALALAITAQSPPATIGEMLAVDPTAAIPLKTVLCTPASKQASAEGTVYGLTPGALPHPVSIELGRAAGLDGRAHAAALKAAHPAIELAEREGSDPAWARLGARLEGALDRLATAHSPLDLPIIPIEARARFDTMAIIYSGDGGWRDIDKKLAVFLQADGVPVVGVDALRYFWRERSPDETAADLARIIDSYRTRWRVKNVVLIGYSFGANILPATLTRLPEAQARHVSLVSLLALGRHADFQISVMGWLGVSGPGKHGDPIADLKTLRTDLVQCVYGLEEKDTGCPDVQSLPGAEVIARPGGHHFDGNYKIIADAIMKRIRAEAAAR
ncbi:Type IV secretory pathway, VirJ component [Rhizobium sp. RU35A]|uniref:virulence factor family protein n=1 Tax=Rhizobium sp. RU35A TaxID=1907414 RepID=UPI000956EEDA|nr:AcvB/VirJ family lysyl-phosphatidylglycerol hydrolase [Rhizobium sp. RU35A]SIP96555.1 Type IV secretory pathway, VirJ component [Rhizobium sp. RU35A]